MDEVKDKMKGLMKKVNKPFTSSSSGKFKGQGRVLGSSSSPSPSSGPANLNSTSAPQSSIDPKQNQSPSSNSKPATQTVSNSYGQKIEDKKPAIGADSDGNEKSENGFNPFNSLITSGQRNPNGYALKVFECPVCGKGYTSEEQVSSHVETCLNNSESSHFNDGEKQIGGENNEVDATVTAYLSGNPSSGSVDVVLKLLRNVVKEPENAKFRKFRMGNLKIKDAIGDVVGGVELFEFMGFELNEEAGEMWLAMDVLSDKRLGLVKNVISLLEPKKVEEPASPSPDPARVEKPVLPEKVDRQTRVFFSVSESVAAKIQLPDSFYKLSTEEIRREAEMRKKKIEESKLLIPKSYKEKQAKAAKKTYNRTVIRIQFPDGVVLQGIFSPKDPTGALYEFVSSALKEPSLEFELLHPVLIKRRVIPHFASSGGQNVTLEDEDLVPAALIKFKPIETDAIVFTGLCNELLEIIEPLKNDSAVPLL